jgi:nucleotide-binding universal stress UspA family protein
MEIRQILAPTDFSECSKQAVACAYELAETFGAKLLLLHVVELQVYPVEVFLPSAEGTTLIGDDDSPDQRDSLALPSRPRAGERRHGLSVAVIGGETDGRV